MEHATHGNLYEALALKRMRFDEKLVRTYFRQLIAGLSCLHHNGLAHMDLKPENIAFAGPDYTLKIFDYDLSLKINERTSKIGRGSENYRSPEQYLGIAKDYRACDIFAAGILLFVMMSGGFIPF
mmetsp:Transcript_73929/g.102719  ORF Transcript_73929/g.102719 Transcript_73929/m.102719 type:complete len:125 (+) Transcript_73929:34-408(+)